MNLADLALEKTAVVNRVQTDYCGEALAQRLEALGISPEREVRVLRKAWFGGPLHVRVGATTEVALRRQEAQQILVTPIDAAVAAGVEAGRLPSG